MDFLFLFSKWTLIQNQALHSLQNVTGLYGLRVSQNIYFTKVSMSEDWDPEMHALENQFMFRFYFFGCLSAGLSKNSDFHDTW